MGCAGHTPQSTRSSQLPAAGLQASYDAYRNQKNLTVIGATQMKWISNTIKKSVAAGTTWQLLAQDNVMLEQ